jgi:pimeloyl-ACP methyl ester carboxylesterase
MVVRQFSYQGLNAAGQPIPYDLAGNMPIQVLGDRMAAQVEKLYRLAGAPVDIVAESEGTLGLYAMLARHPHLPVRSVVLLSPIVQPGQLSQAGGTVPGAALTTLNNLVGGMSPYGRSGAQELIDSVSEVGASYFAQVSRDRGLSWLAVVPLADAVTLPACPMPQNVIFVDAFHGGLLGDPSVRRIVAAFLAGGTPSDRDLDAMAGGSQRDLRSAASLIAAAAAAWRMPDLHAECVGS